MKICIFAGSSPEGTGHFETPVRELLRRLAQAGYSFVYGGGTRGMMGLVAQLAEEYQVKIEGIIPHFLQKIEAIHTKEIGEEHRMPGSTYVEYTITENMHQRKTLMYQKADAFLVLPGGLGTLEEIAEVMTWKKLGLHHAPICLFNCHNFWNAYQLMLEDMQNNGFLSLSAQKFYLLSADPGAIVSYFQENL